LGHIAIAPNGNGDHETWKKVAIGIAVLAVLAILVGITVRQSGKNVATVQTGKAQHQDLSSVVSASGEIGEDVCQHRANAFGKIMHLLVKEGEHVRKGHLRLNWKTAVVAT